MLAVSSRAWLSYSHQARLHLTPLSYDVLDFASGFSSEQCPEGVVAIAANTLRILSLEKLGVTFNQVATPLQYTPRKLVVHPPSGSLVLLETDHNCFTEASKALRKQQMAEVCVCVFCSRLVCVCELLLLLQEMVRTAGEEEQESAAQAAESFLKEEHPDAIFGSPKAGAGMWASCLRVMHPTEVGSGTPSTASHPPPPPPP